MATLRNDSASAPGVNILLLERQTKLYMLNSAILGVLTQS